MSNVAPEFRLIDAFPGYRVGDDGSIWSCWKSNGRNRAVKSDRWRPIIRHTSVGGYLRVPLYRDRKMFTKLVHLLVLEAFVGPRPTGMEGCHRNSRPADCSLQNLRWDTPEANRRDKIANGTHPSGERNGRAKLSSESVLVVRARLNAGEKQSVIARDFGITQSSVSSIKRGETWR